MDWQSAVADVAPVPGPDWVGTVSVRLAEASDLGSLEAVEAAAGAIFRTVGMDAIADGETADPAELSQAQEANRLWVAVTGTGSVVGFLMASILDGVGHLDEVSIHPDVAGRRIGAMLIGEFLAWGRDNGFARLTLTTFAEVPWNRPYYECFGFAVVGPAEWSDAVREQVESEAQHGLDPELRVVMACPLFPTP